MNRLLRPATTVAAVLFVAALFSLTLMGQEKNDKSPTAPTLNANQKYEQKLAEWKAVIKELRALKLKYQTAGEEETKTIQKQWEVLIAKGEVIMPELRAAAVAAYEVSPNTNLELMRTLVKFIEDDVKRDDYEPALKLGQILIQNGCDIREIYNWTGVAAFCTNQFELAEQYLDEAEKLNVLSGDGLKYKPMIGKYKELWAAEEAIRQQEAEKDDLPRVKLTTSKGEIVVELFENEAPETVGNFVNLVEEKFYDGRNFHRVLQGFMAQGGCPRGDGTGGPGYNIYCECYKDNYRKHFRGSLSMAHAGKDTGGSQFFLTFVPTTHLDGRHTVFGRVIDGMDVLARLKRRDPSDPAAPEPDKIEKAEVLRKRDHAYEPNKVQ